MFNNFLMKKMMEAKMKDLPQEERDKFFAILKKNPELFQKIALKSQEKMKSGINQMDAVISVVKENEEELKNILK